MLTCKKCLKSFPCSIKIGDRWLGLQSRKYCLDCSPYKDRPSHHARKLEDTLLDSKGRRFCICEDCDKKYFISKKYSRIHKCATCYHRKNRILKKARMIEYKGGKCARCGYCKYMGALEFHHRDENKKAFGLSTKITASWAVLKKELDKCDLLCSNCHKEIENELWNKSRDIIKNQKIPG